MSIQSQDNNNAHQIIHHCLNVYKQNTWTHTENRDQIFNPGFTTKGVGVGVGLGLAISYRIIEKHNGTIEIESEVEKGTTCRIEIPIETDIEESKNL